MFRLKPHYNKLLKQVLVMLVFLGCFLVSVSLLFGKSSYFSEEGHFKEQPIAFSHQQHTDEVGLDCTFCHTQVERSDFAGMPSAETCFGCHQDILKKSSYLDIVRNSYSQKKPLLWNRVNRLPDHVYFHHARHVNAGIACTHCHGDAHDMPLMTKQQDFTMQWCLSCHKDHHPGSEGPTALNTRLQDCYTCHR
jgi:hypothetical protein